MVLPLQKGVLYGPVQSRRYGRSLGINLSPCDYKLCSFNCIYCHYGLTDKCTTDVAAYVNDMPHPDRVVEELAATLKTSLELDQITCSGNGEPTIHPQFPELVDAVVELRDRYRPKAKVALLSNATGLHYETVRKSIKRIDLPVFKLDAGTPRTFRAVNRPAKGVGFQEIVDNLSEADGIYLQTVFINGRPCNCTPEELTAYGELLRRIRPQEVHLYSIDRPVPDKQISLVQPEDLNRIASELHRATGINVRAFHGA